MPVKSKNPGQKFRIELIQNQFEVFRILSPSHSDSIRKKFSKPFVENPLKINPTQSK